MKKISENTKVTLTLKQLKSLVKESQCHLSNEDEVREFVKSMNFPPDDGHDYETELVDALTGRNTQDNAGWGAVYYNSDKVLPFLKKFGMLGSRGINQRQAISKLKRLFLSGAWKINENKNLVKESTLVANDDIKRALIADENIDWEDLAKACLNYMDEDEIWDMAESEFDYERGYPAEQYRIHSSRGGRYEWRDFDELYEAGNSSNEVVDLDGMVPQPIWYVNVVLKNEDWYEGLFTSEEAAREAVDGIDKDEIEDEENLSPGTDPVLIQDLGKVTTAKDIANAIDSLMN